MTADCAKVAGVVGGRRAGIFAGCIAHRGILALLPGVVSDVRGAVHVVRNAVRVAHRISLITVHAVKRRTHGQGHLAGLARLCAHHGRSDRTPQGQQHCDQQHNEQAKRFHIGKGNRTGNGS